MAGNTRGRLKERFEGIHKDFDWITEHCSQALILIQDKHKGLEGAIKALHAACVELDKLAKGIYDKI